MKKSLYLFAVLFISVSSLFAQELIYEDNFDSYTVGDKIAETAGAPWTTWSGDVGGSEEGTISATQAASPNNSLYIVTNNDIVIDLEDITTGSYRIDFDMLIEAGKVGYFNLLQDFAGGDSEWGMQAYFNSDLTGSVDAGGSSSAEFTYEADTWIAVRLFVNLESDLATLLFDGEELVSWKWSGGSSGGGNLLKLDAVNLFGWDGNKGTAGYYIDNFVFSSLPTITAPENLVATLNGGGIDLTWDAPSGDAPDYYGIVRNKKPLISGITETTYSDLNLYPNTYTYSVTAFYSELGYSPNSNNSIPIEIVGGVERDLVLFEIGTGTNCGYCPGASMGAHELLENGQNVAIIKYQNYSLNDPYYTEVGLERTVAFYEFTGYPTSVADGVLRFSGGSATESLYPAYLNYYNERITRPALYTINMDVTADSENNFNATVTVDKVFDQLENPVKLFVAVTESHAQYNWGNQTEVNNRCIGMYPTEAGSELDFTAKSLELDIPFTFDFDADLVMSDYELIVFIQEDVTKDVIQTIKFNLADATVGIENLSTEKITIYPNPASDFITINTSEKASIKVFDITGKLKISENLTGNTLNISTLSEGVYFISIQTETGVYNTKFIVK